MASSLDVLLFVSSLLGWLQLGLEKLSAGDFVSLGSQGLPLALDHPSRRPPTADFVESGFLSLPWTWLVQGLAS